MRTKDEFRQWALAGRAAGGGDAVADAAALARSFAGWLEARDEARDEFAEGLKPRVLAGYLPMPGELSPVTIMRGWESREECMVAVPAWCRATGRYGFCRWRPGMALRKGPLGVAEPAYADWLSPCMLDVVLVPGLVFDAAGGRIGFGKGHYDRMLARCAPAARFVAVGYDWQVVADVPQGPGDVRVHAVATPVRWLSV